MSGDPIMAKVGHFSHFAIYIRNQSDLVGELSCSDIANCVSTNVCYGDFVCSLACIQDGTVSAQEKFYAVQACSMEECEVECSNTNCPEEIEACGLNDGEDDTEEIPPLGHSNT